MARCGRIGRLFDIFLFSRPESPTAAKCDTVRTGTRGAIYGARFAPGARQPHGRNWMSSSYNSTSERVSVFGPTLRFKGELKAQEDIKIEGRIEGTIEHQQRVIVGSKGEVVAKKSIKVSQSANVRGNIRAPSVSITEGANFNGGVTMESNAGSSGPSTPGASGR